jgi:hypothetical protein
MRNWWRNVVAPWRTAPGWEYDLLRTLPDDVAKRLYQRTRTRLLRTRQWWVFFGLIVPFTWVSIIFVWVAAVVLGLGPAGRVGLELVYHLTVGVIVFHPLARLMQRHLEPHVRAALADELLSFAREELAPAPRQRSRTME